MKNLLLSVAALSLCAGIACAQVAAPEAPPADTADPSASAPPPPPDGAPAPMPGTQPGPGADRRGPPPAPSRAAHFRLEGAGNVLDVQCAENEPMQACADIALRLLDRAAPAPAAAAAP